MAEVVIRLAEGAADVETVRELMREYGAYLADLASTPLGAASIHLEGYEEELAGLPAPYAALLLAEVEGAVAGCVALKSIRVPARPDERAVEIKRLWVRAGHRGLKLGQRLMQGAIDHGRALDAEAVYLDTVPAAMPEANRLYELFGFKQVERYNDNPVADVVFFRLGLGAA